MEQTVNKFIAYILLFFLCLPLSAQPKTGTNAAVTKETAPVRIDSSVTTIIPFKKDFKEHYQGDDFQYETIVKEPTVWDNFKAWLLHWLERIFSSGINGRNLTAFEIIVKILVFAIIIFIVYLIVKTILNKEGKWIFGKSSKKKITTANITEEDIHNIDFQKMIRDSKNKQDYRLSIRYYYLWLLKRLSDRTLIEWDIEKTNSDYLYELKDEKLRQDFKYLSYIYDYSWYGEFELNEAVFEKSEKAFVNTINSI